MGLIECPDCGKQVSDQAASCIHCGRPISRDLAGQPSAGSADAAKKGRQRSKLRNDLGNGIALVGIVVAILIGAAAGSFVAGFVVALLAIVAGVWVAYGS